MSASIVLECLQQLEIIRHKDIVSFKWTKDLQTKNEIKKTHAYKYVMFLRESAAVQNSNAPYYLMFVFQSSQYTGKKGVFVI